ncbi:MAG: LTA synthase family protein [Lachnospiraceae bacterium]|nr:LTA synthase family protein [Lachnospiraceae bacterium]
MKGKGAKLWHWWNSMEQRRRNQIKAAAVGLIGIVFFLVNRMHFYGIDGHGNPSLLKKLLVFYAASTGLVAMSFFIRNTCSDTVNRIINFHLMEWFPLVCFLVVEHVFESDLMQLKLYRIVFNLLLYMCVMYLIYAVSGRVRAAVTGLAVFAALFGIVNIYLMEFRQIPLLASDFTVLKTALNVAGSFTYSLTPEVIYFLCFAVDVIVLAGKICQKKVSRVHRIAAPVLCAGLLAWTLNVVIFSDQYPKFRFSINTFQPIKSYTSNGALLTFTRSFRLMMVDRPEQYSADAVEEITKNYASDSISDEDYKRPNIIVIMNEAFADLQSVGSFETNEEVLPFYHSLKEDTVKGFSYVSVFGGQTANSEFEFLTGDSKAFLPKGSTPYQLYVKEYLPSLTGNLKLDSYQGILAMHPYLASGYNRVSVYQNFGFSKFITFDDFENPKMVRSFISDESDFERIIQEYEEAKRESDAPFYLFNVTMQNHSSYSMDYDNLPDTIKITTPECQNADAERYLNLIHLSDAALQQLIEYFKKQDDPTVVVMFGDHEPGLSNEFYGSILGKSTSDLTDEENMELYKVPFLIWANYDIEERYLERTSLNYLQSILLDAAGMKQSGYNKFLLSMMEEIPAINVSGFFGADGIYYDNEDTNSPYYEKIQEYNILEYNHLFDKQRADTFFELAP